MTQSLLAICLLFASSCFAASLFYKDRFAITGFASIFSSALASCYCIMLCFDLALTEASLGVMLSGVILFASLSPSKNNCTTESSVSESNLGNLIFIFWLCAFCMVLLFFTQAFMLIGNVGYAKNALNSDYTHYYTTHTAGQVGVENIVTAIITSYRGFDTMFETIVISITAITLYFLQSNTKSAL